VRAVLRKLVCGKRKARGAHQERQK